MTSLTKGRAILANAIFVVCGILCAGSIDAGILNDLIHPESAPDLWDNVHVSGYINGHYMNHDGVPRLVTDDSKLSNLNDGFWQLRELSFFVDVSLHDSVTLSSEVEFADDFGTINANYLYADIAASELLPFWDEDQLGQLSIRGGKFLVPFLSYNENKPNFKQYLMSQPFTAWNVAPVIGTPIQPYGFGWSDLGFLVNWARPASDFGIVDFKIAMINGIESESMVLDSNTIQLETGTMMKPTVRPRDGLIQNEGPNWGGSSNGKFAVVGKLAFMTSRFPLDFGFSFYHGAWDRTGTQGLSMFGLHANWISRNWSFKTEWVQAKVDQTAGVNEVVKPGPADINMSTGNYTMQAWYVEGSWIPFRFGSRDDRFVRYDGVNTNDEAKFTPFNRDRFTIGSELEFFTNACLRFEWQRTTINNFDEAPDHISARAASA